MAKLLLLITGVMCACAHEVATLQGDMRRESFTTFGSFSIAGNDRRSGAEAEVTPSTDLSDYVAGDAISISGTDSDGTPVKASFVYGIDGTKVTDLVSFIDGLYKGATAGLDANGKLTLSGDRELSISISKESSRRAKLERAIAEWRSMVAKPLGATA